MRISAVGNSATRRFRRGESILPSLRCLVLALLVLLMAVSGCTLLDERVEAPVLRIGVVAPFSGEYGVLGEAVLNGARLAERQWNERGGVLGMPIELVTLDGGCDFQQARGITQSAVDEQGIRFFVGEVCAEASEAVAQVVTDNDALQISPAAVSVGLTLGREGQVRERVFRMPFVDADQARAAAVVALERLGARRAAILHDRASSYGRALADAFEAAFVAGGGEIVVRRTYDREAETFFDALDPIRDEAPDILYFPGYYPTINVLAAQARSFGLLQVILGSDGWDAPGLEALNVGEAYYTTHFFAQEPRAAVLNWVRDYQAVYQAPPDALATLSYDAVNLLLTAIEQTGADEPAPVAMVLEGIMFDGVSGTMTFDEAHNPLREVIVLRVSQGAVTFEARISPREE